MMQCKEEYADDFEIAELFNKTYALAIDHNYKLPKVESMFVEHPWHINELQQLKEQLNRVKNCLNNYDLKTWQQHTKRRNKAAQVQWRVRKQIEPEFMTQAWCKFYEILSFFNIIPVNCIVSSGKCFASVHLCEAPGAFVVALNHWLKTNTTIKWNWLATTLNPYYEGNSLSTMIDDDRFIRHTIDHWCFGDDNTGNLMDLKNLDKLIKVAKTYNEILLITADGSIDCIDIPNEQEAVVAHLHYCEVVAAMHLLSTGGSFVLKMFTTFEHHSVCLIYLLSCCFNNVYITKPATSKEGNSETYVVCVDFKGSMIIKPYLDILRKHYECKSTNAIFCKGDIDHEFIEKIISYNIFFNDIQSQVIFNNIYTYIPDKECTLISTRRKRLQQMVAEEYIKLCCLKRLSSDFEIVGKQILSNSTIANKKPLYDSYNTRCKKKEMSPRQRLIQHWEDIKEIVTEMYSSKSITFKTNDLQTNLKITIGKTFHRIQSSRFCESRILNIQLAVTRIMEEMNLNMSFPTTEDVDEITDLIIKTENSKILIFRYTDTYCSHKVILSIHDIISVLKPKDNLVLIGYSLLTTSNIGILYFLGNLFASINFEGHDKVGCIIVLKHYKDNAQLREIWYTINTTTLEIQSQNKTILSIFPMTNLYDWVAFPIIVDLNHWIIKRYVNYAVNKANTVL